MLIKLTGYATGRPVLIETDALVYVEELENVYKDNEVYTSLDLMEGGHKISTRVKEACDEILEKIQDAQEGFFDE